MLDGLYDEKYRNERLESCMPGNGHVQFGGGPMEQGNFCTSPAAYPTACFPNFARVWWQEMLSSGCWICCWSAAEKVDGGTARGRQRTDSTHISREDSRQESGAVRGSDHGVCVECPGGGGA